MKAGESWRRAGHGSIAWFAMCEPLAAEAVGAVESGLRLQPRGPLPEPARLRALAAQAPLEKARRSRLADDAIVLVVEAGVTAIDELHLLALHVDADRWRFDFRLLRQADPDLDPAPARMWVWITLEPGTAPPLRQFEFAVTAETSETRFRLELLP